MELRVRIGLTGGIGSGKSTVSAQLRQMGATIVDADVISRSVTGSNGSAIPALTAAFGSSILSSNNALDRARMRRLIYSNPASKIQLEAIVHPLVQTEMQHQSTLAEANGPCCIIFDVPLLLETAYWRRMLHRILVIDCTEQTQISRVMQRDGLSAEQVQRVVLAQVSRLDRLQAADIALFNDGISPQILALRVQEIGAQFGL
jgi:dephospho-CoA kinase